MIPEDQQSPAGAPGTGAVVPGARAGADQASAPPSWWIYHGDGARRTAWTLPDAPPWRRFDGRRPVPCEASAEADGAPGADGTDEPDDSDETVPGGEDICARHGDEGPARTDIVTTYRAEREEARMVNAALRLRRPLLVTGKPGTGKSSLARGIAHELDLGRVLRWSVTSRTTLADGLYAYDAIGRLQDERRTQDPATGAAEHPGGIGKYVRLGPLGTALLPSDRPRVLLIDELDKGDVDLPNDLLSVLEEGEFTIPELQRYPACDVWVMTDDGRREPVRHGRVRCAEFPVVVLTSNGEREFPPAFVRRCVRLDIRPPSRKKLERIVEAHLGPEVLRASASRLERFARDLEEGRKLLATDQLLNTLQMESTTEHTDDPEWPDVLRELLRPLNDTA
ncbi:AAA family ATPase [Streptomyces cucumeris]|uniref:AAA family ATPase n=1 Tax=Streptomyces cucumeris TaxID=2962890 RepID=UPI003EBA0BDD